MDGKGNPHVKANRPGQTACSLKHMDVLKSQPELRSDDYRPVRGRRTREEHHWVMGSRTVNSSVPEHSVVTLTHNKTSHTVGHCEDLEEPKDSKHKKIRNANSLI